MLLKEYPKYRSICFLIVQIASKMEGGKAAVTFHSNLKTANNVLA